MLHTVPLPRLPRNMFQPLLLSAREVTIRDVYRVVIETEKDAPEALAGSRGAADDTGGPCSDARCHSQSNTWSAAPEPPRGAGHFSGALSHVSFRHLRVADRS